MEVASGMSSLGHTRLTLTNRRGWAYLADVEEIVAFQHACTATCVVSEAGVAHDPTNVLVEVNQFIN